MRYPVVVLRTYSLIRPVFGFREDTGETISIPTGELITLMMNYDRLGITTAVCGGNRIMVFRGDVVDNGLQVESSGSSR